MPAETTIPHESRELYTMSRVRGHDSPPIAAAKLVRRCRLELKLLSALLRSPDANSRQPKRSASRLNRHLRQLEAEIASFSEQTESPANAQAMAQPASDLDTRLATEHAFRLSFEPGPPIDPLVASTGHRKAWIAVSAVSLTFTAVCGLWAIAMYQELNHLRDTSGAAPMSARAGASTGAGTASPVVEPPEPPYFDDSVDHLNMALARFPGQDQKQILTRVRDDNAARGINVCSFEWNQGEPRLLFGKGRDHVELDSVMDKCAEAVASAPAIPAIAPLSR